MLRLAHPAPPLSHSATPPTPGTQIIFQVTSKSSSSQGSSGGWWAGFRRSAPLLWPYLLYYLLCLAAFAYIGVHTAINGHDNEQLVLLASAALWMLLVCICIWPPLETLLPREETEEGWKVLWLPRGVQPGGPGGRSRARQHSQLEGSGAAAAVAGDQGAKGRQPVTRVFAGDDDDHHAVVQTAGYMAPPAGPAAGQVGEGTCRAAVQHPRAMAGSNAAFPACINHAAVA